MKLPADSEIARIKVTQYLLKLRDEDDKSKFLSRAGYTLAHADKLLEDLYTLLDGEAEFIQTTEYGDKYRIRHIDRAERPAASSGQCLDNGRSNPSDKIRNSVS
jgi:hypothetical protein